MSDVIEAPVAPPPTAVAPTRTFLPYLEGLRGLFAFYVGLVHMWLRVCQLRPNLTPLTLFGSHFVVVGHSAVGVFMVVSGFVLGLPVAKNGQRLRFGIAEFAKRRALRILPAYYAALCLAIIVSLLVAPVYGETLSHKTLIASIVAHVALVYNFSNRLIDTLNPPMWSIAVEGDVYILFVLMLVPLARRFGFVTMVVAGFALGLLPTFVGALHHRWEGYQLSESCFWYIGLFALGYAAANAIVDQSPSGHHRLETWPWQFLALTFSLVTIGTFVIARPFDLTHGTRWLSDIFLGLALASQLMADAQIRARGGTSWFERLCLWRPLLLVGTFSYSYYLIHLPIIDLILSRGPAAWSDPAFIALGYGAVAIALVAAYGFYRVFERPFMTSHRRRGDDATLQSSHLREIADRA
jgi:peptidoglycan/LPS O-acetylase OafA/YrhL